MTKFSKNSKNMFNECEKNKITSKKRSINEYIEECVMKIEALEL